MNTLLLDGVGAAFFVIAIGLGLFFMIVAIFLEAWVMTLMKYHTSYKQAAIHSLVVNLVTLVAGFLLISNTDFFSENNTAGILLLFAVTVVVEGIALYLLNKEKPVMRTAAAALVMNVVTYAIAFLFFNVF